MMNGQAALLPLSAFHHYHLYPSSNQSHHQFAIQDIGPAAVSGGLGPHHLYPHQQLHAVSANSGNLGLASASTRSFAGSAVAACGTPAGPFHPLPLPFRPAGAAPPAADLPANYNTAGQAIAHQHQFARSAILTPQRMAAYSAQQQQDDELARFQELSNKWEPDATVSVLQASHGFLRCISLLSS
jgi:hypothetical protein